MNELSTESIIEMHNDIIADSGGTEGILCEGTIDFLIFRCNQKNDVFSKAACVLRSIIQNHPFMDGNKRTAFGIAEFIINEEGYYLNEKNEEIIEFLRKIATTNTDDCESVSIKDWIKRRSKRLKKPITIV